MNVGILFKYDEAYLSYEAAKVLRFFFFVII